jgi:hypothetical protein
VFRLHQARPADLRKGKRLGKLDRLFTWDKPLQRPRYLPKAIWMGAALKIGPKRAV